LKPALIIEQYFVAEKTAIEAIESQRDGIAMQLEEMEEEHGGDEGLLINARNDKDKITAASVKDRLRSNKAGKDDKEERKVLEAYLKLADTLGESNRQIKDLQKALETKVWNQYKLLTDMEIKTLVVDNKWIKTIDSAIHTEMQRISQRLTQRIKELADRYDTPMPLLLEEVGLLEEKVNAHLAKMGFSL
jgi:type I restriction enzyme M protein